MRLINTTTLKLEHRRHTPDLKYGILSHRWSEEEDYEVSFDDMLSGKKTKKPGFAKIQRVAKIAKEDGFNWVWVDTCCIDKRSSAELTESINSMFMWYQESARCYAYLQDVGDGKGLKQFGESEWFERGWTLQELLAPKEVLFYDRNWKKIGDKRDLAAKIAPAARIDYYALTGGQPLSSFSIAQKMTWAANRRTTLPEDLAYCLLGIFDVNMTPIYGEREKAFVRLQEEIIKRNDDRSIFTWQMYDDIKISGILASHPEQFSKTKESSAISEGGDPFSITNRGLSISLELTPWRLDTYVAFLQNVGPEVGQSPPGIFLRRLHKEDHYVRVNVEGSGGLMPRGYYEVSEDSQIERRHIFISTVGERLSDRDMFNLSANRAEGLFVPPDWQPQRETLDTSEAMELQVLTAIGRDLEILNLPLDPETSTAAFGFSQIGLGFNFDFEPICILKDPERSHFESDESLVLSAEYQGPNFLVRNPIDSFDNEHFTKTRRGYHRLMRKVMHDGLWRLKGDRRNGLYVLLQRAPTDIGVWLRIKRVHSNVQDRTRWTVSLEKNIWISEAEFNPDYNTK